MNYNDIKAKASTAFSKIGTTNGTSAPTSLDNRASIAHEYFIADVLASIATKRKDEAKKAALSAGILGEDYVEGQTMEVYSNENLTISAKTNNAAETLDKTKIFSELVKEVGAEKAAKIMQAATKKNKPATSYIFSVK
jgi:hypothetical protein